MICLAKSRGRRSHWLHLDPLVEKDEKEIFVMLATFVTHVFSTLYCVFFQIVKFMNKECKNMLTFPPLITIQSLHNLLCGLAKCTLHSYISLKGIPKSCDALTKLHFREGNFAERRVYVQVFQNHEICFLTNLLNSKALYFDHFPSVTDNSNQFCQIVNKEEKQSTCEETFCSLPAS